MSDTGATTVLDSWEDGETYNLEQHPNTLVVTRKGRDSGQWPFPLEVEKRRHAALLGELRSTEAVSAEQAREIARLQRELAESRGVWRLAVRELLRPVPDVPRREEPPPPGNWQLEGALAEADILRASLGTLSKIAESHGPQKLADFLAQKLDRAALLDRVIELVQAHGFTGATASSVIDFVKDRVVTNSRIAHLHGEQVRSLDKKLVQEGQRITLLKVRFQELRDLVAEALEI